MELLNKKKNVLEETNNQRIVRNIFNEITKQAAEYLNNENFIGLYVECNDPSKPESYDSFLTPGNQKPYVSLNAVYDESMSGNIGITSFVIESRKFGNYSFITSHIPANCYTISENKGRTAYKTCISLFRGIILFDKNGLLTEAKEELPFLLNERLAETPVMAQDIEINKVLSKKLPIIGIKM